MCDVFKRLTIKPDYPKHTNIKEKQETGRDYTFSELRRLMKRLEEL